MPINASLFGHIQNDAFLTGTYELEGHQFNNTIKYLKNYLSNSINEQVNPNYTRLLKDLEYLLSINQKIGTTEVSGNIDTYVNTIASDIIEDMQKLKVGARLLIPGGWLASSGGHAMIYEMARNKNSYYFRVYNSGSGLSYHAKKSSTEKELYNPTKTWDVPLFASKKKATEFVEFIKNLLKAQRPPKEQQIAMSCERLYKQLLPSIVYAGGVEVDSSLNASIEIPDFGYTAGQLSGTCAQRCIHQMLKLSSHSLQEYQRFIFKFKMHALEDYSSSCFKSEVPFNTAVVEQILLAIENNLKILNGEPELFYEQQTQAYLNQLVDLKKSLNTMNYSAPKHGTISALSPQCQLKARSPEPMPAISGNFSYYLPEHNAISFNDNNLLECLEGHINHIKEISDYAHLYNYLEKLLLALPISPAGKLNMTPYKNLLIATDYQIFEKHMRALQKAITVLQEKWLNENQISKVNILALCAASIQTDAYNALNELKGIPSFNASTNMVLESLIANHRRNPFLATNTPKLDGRFQELLQRYRGQSAQDKDNHIQYLKDIVDTEPELKEGLESLYMHAYEKEDSDTHKFVREQGLKALYMISIHLQEGTNQETTHDKALILEARYQPVIEKIKAHLEYEAHIAELINPFIIYKLPKSALINFTDYKVEAPLEFFEICKITFSQKIIRSKYNLPDSAAKQALESDVPERSSYWTPIKSRSANHIQLHPEATFKTTTQLITQNDIVARDYYHLRSNPEIQIELTLDYFKRHVGQLTFLPDRLYLEANLFQPGILLPYIKKQGLSQFDSFISVGFNFYCLNGQHTSKSLFFLRLNYLVSNYLTLAQLDNGIYRLSNIQADIKTHLQTTTNPHILYVLHYYLFLVSIAKLQVNAQDADDYALAIHSFFYVQTNSPSKSFEDATDQIDFSCAIAHFQLLLNQKYLDNPDACSKLIEKVVIETNDALIGFNIKGQFPVYSFTNASNKEEYTFNAMLGKLFKNGLALSGIPIDIRNNPLIKHLHLDNQNQCLMSNNGSYLCFPHDPHETKIYRWRNNELVVQQKWVINGISAYYELQGLSTLHEAIKGTRISPLHNSLPQVLTDACMNFWASTTRKNNGILIQNHTPRYFLNDATFFALDDKGFVTEEKLSPLNEQWAELITAFESSRFVVHHKTLSGSFIELPRYGLHFTRQLNKIILTKTNEELIPCAPPIQRTAGIVLAKDKNQRFVVPVTRFYATNSNAIESDVYPVIHDISGVIAKKLLEEYPEYKNNPSLWNYKNSQRYVSFRLIKDIPSADTTADALYLAYIYLATHQPQKAWAVLEDCRTRLGGLTGVAEELKYCTWICNDIPFILPEKNKLKEAIRKAPPYTACKLKTLSILCDYLSQDNQINLPTPKNEPLTANILWDRMEHKTLSDFLKALPLTIYIEFQRYQAVRRHLEAQFNLSSTERKRLLNYYQQEQVKNDSPKGALGYEWMLLNLELLQQEQQNLIAYLEINPSSTVDSERLTYINTSLERLEPIVAHSSALKMKAINLGLDNGIWIKKSHLSKASLNQLDKWWDNLPGTPLQAAKLDEAVAALSSNISENDLIIYFPAYLQIMLSNNQENQHRFKAVMDFCTNTLIAERHISWSNQTKNRKFLCNLLYRVAYIDDQNFSSKSKYHFYYLEIKCRESLIPELKVYEVVDVYESILASPKAILAQQKRLSYLPAPQSESSYHPLISLMAKDSKLSYFINQYELLQTDYEKTNQSLIKALTSDLEKAHQQELQAGINQLRLEGRETKLSKELLDNEAALAELEQITKKAQPKVAYMVEQLWQKALDLANEGPADTKQALIWKIDRESKKRAILNKIDLNRLYTQNNMNYTTTQTGLSMDKAHLLHKLIHDALVHGIQLKMIGRIQHSINKAKKNNDAQELVLGLTLFAKKTIPGLENQAMVMLQHEDENITLLRPRQISALQNLLAPSIKGKFNEIVEKVIPGGGKSTAIIPISAQHKANQTNLVIQEVPQALLATNHVDFNRSSQRLYGKSAFRFEFNRDSNCSAKRLQQIYNQFIEIKHNRDYIITTGESMQSLELKYIELLLKEEDQQTDDWKQQLFWADTLVALIHNHGDAMIDEVHQGLWIKKKLNYTVGSPKPLPQQTIKNTLALFRYIPTDFIQNAPDFDENYDWTVFQKELANKLLTEKDSPLEQFITNACKKYGNTIIEELRAYLINAEEAIYPKAILDASPQIKISLGFFKQQISWLLPKTLIRRLDEKYGASKKTNLTAIERTLAIPFLANNIPNERSRFSTLESINNSCQMMLIKGISKELLKEKISLWRTLARQELLKAPHLKHIDNTKTAYGVQILCSKIGLKLSEFKLDDNQQLEELHALLKNHRSLIFELLEQQTLKLIRQDGEIIHSDSFNHVDMYHSTQGVSGTPTPNTHHQRLKYDYTSSLGSDGYIIELINSKETLINYADYKNTEQFINQILSCCASPQKCRAIIDIKATFQGVENITVAKALASYISTHQGQFSHLIKHVLYFDDEQILCALNVNEPASKPIVLKSSNLNEINRLLDSTPEARFTYYDQVRTLGTDITQYEEAHALVLIDEKIALPAFLQGAMRMRGLGLKQTLELIAPKKLKPISREELISKFTSTHDKTILEDTRFAVTGQMTNVIRRTCLDAIQKIAATEAKTKAKLAKSLKTFLVQTPSNDYSELYGALSKKQDAKILFDTHKIKLLTQWRKACEAANITLSEQEINTISKQLDDIITNSLPYCDKEYEQNTDNALGLEIEVQKEVLIEAQVQVAIIKESFSPELVERPPVDWNYYSLRKYNDKNYLDNVAIPINKICAPLANKNIAFSSKLYLSKSYAKVYYQQEQILDGFLKPVLAIWYHWNNEVLSAMLLTPQDVAALQEKISTAPFHWIATTEDTVLCGIRPSDILEHIQYHLLKEQIRFFNGEFSSLLNPETPLNWLNENSIEKLDFFEHHILPFRPRAIAKFQEFKTVLQQTNNEGYIYILNHPFEDLTQCDWLSLFPETSSIQEIVYKRLALVFHNIYLNFQKHEYQNVDISQLQQQFHLPVDCLEIIKTHLIYLETLGSLLLRLQELSQKQGPFTPNDKERALLEECLDQPLDDFYKKYSSTPFNSFETSLGICCLIDMISQVCSHRSLNETKAISKAFDHLSQATNSEAVQLELLKIKNRSPKVDDIIARAPKSPNVVDALLEATEFNKERIEQLVPYCSTEAQQLLLLKKGIITDKVIETLLAQMSSNKILLELLPYANHNHLHMAYIKGDVEIRKAIYAHRLFNMDLLRDILHIKAIDETKLLELLTATFVKGMGAEALCLILSDPQYTEQLIYEKLVQHASSIQLGLFIPFENTGKLNHHQLQLLEQKCSSSEHIDLLLQRQDLDNLIHSSLLKRPLTEAQLIKLAQSSYTDNVLINTYNHKNSTLNVKKALYANKWFSSKTLEALLDAKPLDEDKSVISLPENPLIIDSKALLEISKKFPNNPQIIDVVMAHPKKDNEVIAELLKNQTWTAHHILNVLEHPEIKINTKFLITMMEKTLASLLKLTPENDSLWEKCLFKLRSHFKALDAIPQMVSLLEQTSSDLLNDLHKQQKRMQQEATLSQKPQQLLDAALEKLRIKALSHTIRSLTNPSYHAPARSATALYKTLSNYKKELNIKPKHALPPIMDAINKAKPILAVHRGYKQVFLDILNAVLSLVTLGLKACTTKNWRFFTANTDSINVLNDLSECIDQFNPCKKSSLK